MLTGGDQNSALVDLCTLLLKVLDPLDVTIVTSFDVPRHISYLLGTG